MGIFKVIVGVMGSSKSMRALAEIFNLRQKGIHTLVVKSTQDSRDNESVSSRLIPQKVKADLLLRPDEDVPIEDILSNNYKYIIVDESHMLSVKQIEQLYKISAISHTNISLYGLRMSFKGYPFPSTAAAIGYADKVEMIEAEDQEGNILTHHIKLIDGKPCDITAEGEIVLPGDIISNGDEAMVCYKTVSKKDFYKIYGILGQI